MDGKKKVPPPRPVTVAKKKMPVSDWLACGWALLSACAIALGHYHRLFCSQATLIVRCGSVELTGKKAIYFSALWIGALCCAASQAAAAALALLLPRRHRWVSREDLAFLAVVLNSAGHCMYNGSVYILRRGDYFTVASLWFWVGDIISSLLLQGRTLPR
uniref:Uncharacterized protein n=1 Tax=Aegilops tauschii subsp. strangulata TaxID=200361 RepID=A0A453D8J4_AEGTS